MQSADGPEALHPPAPEEAAALRQALAAAGYSDKGLIAALGAVHLPTPRTHNLPRLMRLTAGGSPIETLARLFLFGVPVPSEAVRAALAPFPLEALDRMGLVDLRGADVEGKVILYPYGPLLIAFDRPDQIVTGARPDYVMGLTSSTLDVANLLPRRPVRSALDLGAGCGVLAFLAAQYSQSVCAVDYSPRAAAFARFGAALNGLANVECLEGDRFAPVHGRRFDLVFGNLPFIIAPSSSYLYRDGGMAMDGFAESVLRNAPEYLEEGGFCHMLCEWAHFEGEDWQRRLHGWFEGSGCDVFVIKLSTANPLLYAEVWIRDTEKDDPEVFARTYGEWADWYQANRIDGISTGLITMRRRSGAENWFHLELLARTRPRPLRRARRPALRPLRFPGARAGARATAGLPAPGGPRRAHAGAPRMGVRRMARHHGSAVPPVPAVLRRRHRPPGRPPAGAVRRRKDARRMHGPPGRGAQDGARARGRAFAPPRPRADRARVSDPARTGGRFQHPGAGAWMNAAQWRPAGASA